MSLSSSNPSLTSYDPSLSENATKSPPSLVSYKKIESILFSILTNEPSKIFDSQKKAFQLGTQEYKDRGFTSSLPIQTAGQTPQPSLKAGEGAQMCIKTGYVKGGDVIVTKVAAGGGKAGNTGAVLVFHQDSLRLLAILCDEGLLTEVRTAAACVYASQFILGKDDIGRCKQVLKIGMIGGGVQAVWQLRFLAKIVSCRNIVLKTRSRASADAFIQRMTTSSYLPDREWVFEHYDTNGERFKECQLIHTLTPSRSPVLMIDDVNLSSGFLHVTTVGADSSGKVELDLALKKKASMLICDSISQTIERGEYQTFELHNSLVEIGTLTEEKMNSIRATTPCVTIFDSSGLAFQDVEIANLICAELDK